MDKKKLAKNLNVLEFLDLDPALSAYLEENGYQTVKELLSLYFSTVINDSNLKDYILKDIMPLLEQFIKSFENFEEKLLDEGKIRSFLDALNVSSDIDIEHTRNHLRACFKALQPSDWNSLLETFKQEYATGYLGVEFESPINTDEENDLT
ncbi:hypothetical protein ACFL03_08815 [Thermodesulfobacteriota bacterium]